MKEVSSLADMLERTRRFDAIDLQQITLHQQKQSLVDTVLERTIKSRRKSAGAEIVEALHSRTGNEPAELAKLVWKSIRSGTTDKRWADNQGFLITVADLCFARGRLDVVRSVVAAGRPAWMDIADHTVELSLLKTDSGPELIQALCEYKLGPHAGAKEGVRNLFQIATEQITPHSRVFLECALDLDPGHPYVAFLRSTPGEGSALLAEIEMSRYISAVAKSSINSTPPGAGQSRRRAQI